MSTVESNSPILIHIHVPKCGGTSFRSLLANQLSSRHLSLYVDNTHYVYPEAYLDQLVRSASILSVSSHFIRTFPPTLGGRRAHYVTFLRHPISHFLSYRNYVCKAFPAITDTALLESLPPKANELTSREFARWVLTESPVNAPFRESYTTNFLAREVFRATSSDNAGYRASRLSLAKEALQQFLFVGLTEELGASIPTLVEMASKNGIKLHPDRVGFENCSHEFSDDTSWVDPQDEVGRLLFASIEEDLQLYRWARSRFGRVGGLPSLS